MDVEKNFALILQIIFVFLFGFLTGTATTAVCFLTNPRIARKYYAKVQRVIEEEKKKKKKEVTRDPKEKSASKPHIE